MEKYTLTLKIVAPLSVSGEGIVFDVPRTELTADDEGLAKSLLGRAENRQAFVTLAASAIAMGQIIKGLEQKDPSRPGSYLKGYINLLKYVTDYPNAPVTLEEIKKRMDAHG